MKYFFSETMDILNCSYAPFADEVSQITRSRERRRKREREKKKRRRERDKERERERERVCE
jgi:hypothetical protein